jgi:hypothetical protein
VRRPVIAVLAAAALVAGGIGVVRAATTTTTAACTANPVVSDVTTGQRITVVCTVPKPSQPTVTQTVTVPGPTVTATTTVTATPTPTVTPSTSAPATPTATPTSSSPTATPTNSPAGTVADASNTGWRHTGVTLRTVKAGDSGAGWSAETVGGNPVFYVRTAGAVIDGLDIPMCVKVMANNVTIKRSRISCASYYTVNVSDPPIYYIGLTLTDDEIDGQNSLAVPGIAVMANAGATYSRAGLRWERQHLHRERLRRRHPGQLSRRAAG